MTCIEQGDTSPEKEKSKLLADSVVDIFGRCGLSDSRLRGIAFGYGIRLEDVDDVYHNALVNVLSKGGRTFVGDINEGNVSKWFLRIYQNCCKDFKRAAKRKRKYFLDSQTLEIDEFSDSYNETPGDIYEKKERRINVSAAVSRLPQKQREVIVGIYYEGKKYDEVATQLNIPVGTVKSRAHVALEKLEVLLKA